MDHSNNTGIQSEYSINKVLERLVQPYDAAGLEGIRHDLMSSRGTRLIHTWNGYHLDDLVVYEICTMNDLDFDVWDMDFSDVNEAAVYICKRQMKRPDLAAEYKKYLIGQRFACEQACRKDIRFGESKRVIAKQIARELIISPGTVLKYYVYSSAINVIFDNDTFFAKMILSGKLRISHENLIELSRLRPEEIKAVFTALERENIDHITLTFIRNEVKWSHVKRRNEISRRQRSEESARGKVKGTIREMPEYDPDSEVNSLCMTMDSWISIMQRVINSENFPKITYSASLRLMKKLSALEHTVTAVQDSIERMGN